MFNGTSESKKMRIVKVDKKKLIQQSIGLSSLAAVFCLFWTIFDIPQPHSSLEVTSDKNDLGETVVQVSYSCNSGESLTRNHQEADLYIKLMGNITTTPRVKCLVLSFLRDSGHVCSFAPALWLIK